MKKFLAVILCLAFILFILSGCDDKVIVAKEPIDTRFSAAHDEVVYDGYWIGDYYVHDNYTVFHADKYEVRYRITYDDESRKTAWLEVDKDEYDRARDKLP